MEDRLATFSWSNPNDLSKNTVITSTPFFILLNEERYVVLGNGK